MTSTAGNAELRLDARWHGPLVALAVAYSFFHHVGTLAAPLGEVGDTRWADWIDMLTPYVMVGLAVWVLFAAGGTTRQWAAMAFGAIAYTHGHGIHLAANAVGNVARSDIAHFWDEYVGHYVAYSGLAVLFAALASALVHRQLASRPVQGVLAHGLAVFVGITHFTNSIQGEFSLPGMAISAAFAIWGFRTRRHFGRLLLTAYGLSLALFVAYGFWHQGFPEFG